MKSYLISDPNTYIHDGQLDKAALSSNIVQEWIFPVPGIDIENLCADAVEVVADWYNLNKDKT
ncbi:MAG: hypothetical protein WC942_04070 [Clostridia bacterium]|jgi:hypothetical protein